ncbi:hypothetical protein LF887_14095 [Chryseobacterium sp. MEBOG06]|uniref:hypothetical protein n=1 Tax=Chryseobacterium sp. MEBOG06 TaxID=2879938 RepID=UPI001F2F61F0|nr:hypothetical protein [Chryseobacterium sp. MEBOG06]UKB82137.1 hypothetical protein LF887_14095 [Chryseobacterium sp. MEBOG06]
MKKTLTFTAFSLLILSCTKKKESLEENKYKERVKFGYLSDYPQIKDSSKFITNLRQTFNLIIHESPAQQEGEKITAFKKVKINGSDENYYFIEYNWKVGSTGECPWKYQLIVAEDGRLVKRLAAQRYEFLSILPNENPFLLTTIVTGKGNGGHELYRVTADSLENVYEGYYDYKLRTYDAHEDSKVYEPNELKLLIKDFNKDGLNDIAFTGKIVLIQGHTPQGDWYDTEVINGKQVKYSVDHPFKKIPVEYIFLYDKKTKHFKAKEDYKEKYELFE